MKISITISWVCLKDVWQIQEVTKRDKTNNITRSKTPDHEDISTSEILFLTSKISTEPNKIMTK